MAKGQYEYITSPTGLVPLVECTPSDLGARPVYATDKVTGKEVIRYMRKLYQPKKG